MRVALQRRNRLVLPWHRPNNAEYEPSCSELARSSEPESPWVLS